MTQFMMLINLANAKPVLLDAKAAMDLYQKTVGYAMKRMDGLTHFTIQKNKVNVNVVQLDVNLVLMKLLVHVHLALMDGFSILTKVNATNVQQDAKIAKDL